MRQRDRVIPTVALLAGLIGLAVWCIRRGTWAYSLLISLGIVALYVLSMEISRRASVALMALPYSAEPNYRVLLPLTVKIALPLYLCLFCVACIPLFRWELWFLTGLPILALLCIPLLSIMEELHDRRLPRRFFLAVQLGMLTAIYLSGQLVAWGLVHIFSLT